MARYRVDWQAVQAFYDAGNDRDACIGKFGFRLPAWYKAIRSGRLKASLEPRFNWSEIQRYYDEGHTYRECRIRFAFKPATWGKAVKRGDIRPRPRRWSVEKVLRESMSRATVKRCLLDAGILRNVCEECGISEWRGKPLSIQLDHRNGIWSDHRVENLRMLCPNCHSQTHTFGRRNKPYKQSRVV